MYKQDLECEDWVKKIEQTWLITLETSLGRSQGWLSLTGQHSQMPSRAHTDLPFRGKQNGNMKSTRQWGNGKSQRSGFGRVR